MAWDVLLMTFILCFLVLFRCMTVTCLGGQLKVPRWATFLDDNLFFELIEPEEISYSYKIRPAKNFGAVLNTTFYGVDLVVSDPLHGCSDLYNVDDILGSIALVERGGCSFLGKTLQAEKAGALAIIIMDNDYSNDQRMIDMIGDDTDRDANIPAFFLMGKDGYMIHRTLGRLHLERALINIPINATGLHTSRLARPPWTLW